jgi:hypothetical protein
LPNGGLRASFATIDLENEKMAAGARIGFGLIVLAALAGCTESDQALLRADSAAATAEFNRPIADFLFAARGRPFADGPISIVADDDGEFRTFQLYPCGENTACYNSPTGRRLSVEHQLYATIIRGIEPGHDYVLSSGGDGHIDAHGLRKTSLAWQASEGRTTVVW